MKKILIAHEGKQHSFRTAEALYKDGILLKYITTVYDKPFSKTRWLKLLLKGNIRKRCSSRRTEALPDEMIMQFDEWKGLLLLFLHRVTFFKNIIPHYYNWLHDGFGKKVADYAIANSVDAIIMYDTNANKCWEILKKKAPHIKRILDVSISNRLYLKTVYEYDAINYNDSLIMNEQFNDLKFSKRLESELNLSDYLLAGSQFVKYSLEFNRVPANKISIVPYGVNSSTFGFNKEHSYNTPLKLIFVGTVSYRKGIHHLLNVVSQYSSDKVQLAIVGTYSKTADYYRRYAGCDNISYKGFVTHDILAQYYSQADIFVLPSLAEGFAQVSLEAMSCGLPVICTENSGCNDAIVNYENGIVIPPSDRNALKQAIDWFIQNKDKLPEMRIVAHTTAMSYTWERYYNNVVDAVKQMVK